MAKRIQIGLVGALVFALASIALAAEPTYPTIVARFNQRNITQTIPSMTVFTPAETGLYRVSVYLTVVVAVSSDSDWQVDWNWTDDAGPENTQLAFSYTYSTPLAAWFTNPIGAGVPEPVTFEAVAGQPVSFNLYAPPGNTGAACSMAMIVERLE
jgi:hypothetical protein